MPSPDYTATLIMDFSTARVQIIALLFSIAVHLAGAGLAEIFKPDPRKASNTAPLDTLQVTFEQIQSAPDPVTKPEPKKEPEPEPEPKPVIKPVPVAKPQPKTPDKPEPEKKTVSKTRTKQANESVQRQKKVASSPVKAIKKTVAIAPVADVHRIDYFSQLQAYIESRKYYPRTARKQGIEGRVEVSFILMNNGEARDIHSSGAHRLLNHAASRAIKKSLPFPAPPDDIGLPKKVHFSMHYDLQRQ